MTDHPPDGDLSVELQGSLVLFYAHTARAQEWFDAYTDAERLGDAYVVEHRYAADIAHALQAVGFTFTDLHIDP